MAVNNFAALCRPSLNLGDMIECNDQYSNSHSCVVRLATPEQLLYARALISRRSNDYRRSSLGQASLKAQVLIEARRALNSLKMARSPEQRLIWRRKIDLIMRRLRALDAAHGHFQSPEVL